MLKEEKKYYLIEKSKICIFDNKKYLIELKKPQKELGFTKQDFIDSLTEYYFGDEEKLTRTMKKTIKDMFEKLPENYVMIIQTVNENEKKFKYTSNKIVEIDFIKWWKN